MEFRRCQPPCARFIAREDPHSKCIKCLGFSHARDAVYGTSKCKICDDFRLITLRSRLEDCERESSIFPRCASSTSAAHREIAASREAATWGLDVELEEKESEQTGLAFSLPPSPERVRANSPVEFLHDFLFPSPRARDTVSFGLDDILHTAASDSEDFRPDFSAICIERSPFPGFSHFPPALLTRRPLTSPTLWVLWSRVTPPCR